MNRIRIEKNEKAAIQVIREDSGVTIGIVIVEPKHPNNNLWKKHGYQFMNVGQGFEHHLWGIPISYGKTGNRTFYCNNLGTIRGSDNNGQIADVSIMKTWPVVDGYRLVE